MLATSIIGGGKVENVVVDLNDKQRKKVEKELLKDRFNSQIGMKKVLRSQLEDHNNRLQAFTTEKKNEE